MAKIPIEITSDSADAQRDLDRLEKGLSGIEQAGQEAQAGLDDVGDSADKASEGFKIAGLSITDLKSAMDLAGQALSTIGDIYDATIGSVLAYSDQVRDLARISGASTEETSRLIQASDDLQVEYGTLEAAAKALAKDGIALTTEELAKASDEYLKIEGAGARAEYATTKFGRAGLELTKVLETGGAALREMAAATGESMVLTEEQTKAARDLEIALDGAEDSLQGVAYTVGNVLIPEFTKLMTSVNNVIGNLDRLLTWEQKMLPILRQHADEVIKSGASWEQYSKEMLRAKTVSDQSSAGQAKLAQQLRETGGDLDKLMGLWGLYDKAAFGAAQRTAFMAVKAQDLDKSLLGLAPTLNDLALALQNEEGAFTDTGSAAANYNNVLGLTSSAVSELTTKYGSLSQAQIYNKLAAGMSEEGAIKLGIAMGILDPVTMAAVDALDSLNARYQGGERHSKAYAGQAEALAAAIKKLQDKSVTITTYFNNVGQPMTPEQQAAINPNNPNGPGQTGGPPEIDRSGVIYRNAPVAPDNPITPEKYADGGQYTIPAGHNEDWPVGANAVASSGETVTITPKNKLAAPSVTNHYTINVIGWQGDGVSLAAEIERQQKIKEIMNGA